MAPRIIPDTGGHYLHRTSIPHPSSSSSDSPHIFGQTIRVQAGRRRNLHMTISSEEAEQLGEDRETFEDTSPDDEGIIEFDSCWPGMGTTTSSLTLYVGAIIDEEASLHLGHTTIEDATKYFSRMLALGTNRSLFKQMKIMLQPFEVFSMGINVFPDQALYFSSECPNSPEELLTKLTTWIKLNQHNFPTQNRGKVKIGSWALFTRCNFSMDWLDSKETDNLLDKNLNAEGDGEYSAPIIAGMSWVDGVCSRGGTNSMFVYARNDSWKTLLHEMGHQLGAGHTFPKYERGSGQGVMDYHRTRKYKGHVQFHEMHQTNICKLITERLIIDAPLPCFQKVELPSPIPKQHAPGYSPWPEIVIGNIMDVYLSHVIGQTQLNITFHRSKRCWILKNSR